MKSRRIISLLASGFMCFPLLQTHAQTEEDARAYIEEAYESCEHSGVEFTDKGKLTLTVDGQKSTANLSDIGHIDVWDTSSTHAIVVHCNLTSETFDEEARCFDGDTGLKSQISTYFGDECTNWRGREVTRSFLRLIMEYNPEVDATMEFSL